MARMIEGFIGGALFVPGIAAALLTACAPKYTQPPVFPPLAYRADAPSVGVFPGPIVPLGREMTLVARTSALPADVTVCLRVVDADGAKWFESCGDAQSRRVPFLPGRAGRHLAYLAVSRDGETWATHAAWKSEFCVLGENAGCP